MNASAQEARILLVDDDVDICHNLTDILGDLGYSVDMAHNGLDALALVKVSDYDVALLDLRMPGMDGVTLFREIKKLSSRTVGVIVTAFASQATTDEALDAGAWRVVAKPVDLPRLLAIVDEALGQPLVLVVDDDRDLCQNLWDLLRERGYRVGLAHDQDEAVGQLRSAIYRVVLIDMRLPDGDGTSVFEAVQRISPEARTVIVTGFRQEVGGQVERVLKEGADLVCYKPFQIPELLSAIEQLSQQPRSGSDG